MKRMLVHIRRPVRALFRSSLMPLLSAGFAMGALAYVSILSDAGRAELISNFTALV